MSPTKQSLPLFTGLGVELEYMIVDRETLSVLPVADELLRDASGEVSDEVERGPLCWSNELVLHLLELKTNGPVSSPAGLPALFSRDVYRINELLLPLGGQLMPGGMHPFMDPAREARLWPHGNRTIYETYHRIFDCRRHGFANLQSIHLNLSFRGDEEFARLHAAVRFLMPILPAIAAASPVVEGRVTGLLDSRLEAYGENQRRIPSIAGRVIPESIRSRRQYRDRILRRIYRDIATHDPDGILRHEWLNSRGAIPRFDRDTIELRVLDMQECPQADIAIVAAVVAVLKQLVSGELAPSAEISDWEIEPLEEIFLAAIRDGESAVIRNRAYLGVFGLDRERATAGELWNRLVDTAAWADPEEERTAREALSVIRNEGTLARRILRRLGGRPTRARIEGACRELCACLSEGRMLRS